MRPWPWKLVTFDIDGTLTRGHGWRFLAEHTGQRAAFEATNRRFFAGESDENAHLRALLDLAVGRTPADVLAIVAAGPKIAGIRESVEELHRRGAQVALLSHNPEFIEAWYQSTYGFDDAEGIQATRLIDGRVVPYPPLNAEKLVWMHRLLSRRGLAAEGTVHVGDGRADALVFPHVGGGVALNSELPEVRAAADLALEADDLRSLVPRLAELTPRRL